MRYCKKADFKLLKKQYTVRTPIQLGYIGLYCASVDETKSQFIFNIRKPLIVELNIHDSFQFSRIALVAIQQLGNLHCYTGPCMNWLIFTCVTSILLAVRYAKIT
jgi:hypothetical protein